jgi:hypothetical protein
MPSLAGLDGPGSKPSARRAWGEQGGGGDSSTGGGRTLVRGLSPSSYTVFLALIALVVAVGTIVVYRLRREVDEDLCPVTDEELLRDFERAYFAGEMDEAEFRSVTAALKAKKSGTPKPAVVPPPTEPETPEPAPDEHAEGSEVEDVSDGV